MNSGVQECVGRCKNIQLYSDEDFFAPTKLHLLLSMLLGCINSCITYI